MKRKRFSTEQIVAALKQVELGLPVADLIRQLGISEQTYYRWKKSYAGLESDQVRELRQVVEENALFDVGRKRVGEVDLLDALEREVPLTFTRLANGAGDRVAGAQVEAAHL